MTISENEFMYEIGERQRMMELHYNKVEKKNRMVLRLAIVLSPWLAYWGIYGYLWFIEYKPSMLFLSALLLIMFLISTIFNLILALRERGRLLDASLELGKFMSYILIHADEVEWKDDKTKKDALKKIIGGKKNGKII
jgi:hypothetical protein